MQNIPGSSEDCRICGQDQKHRPQCYVGLAVCSGACEDKLEALVAAEVRGDVAAAERERVVVTGHYFWPDRDRDGLCASCGRARDLHALVPSASHVDLTTTTPTVPPLGREAWQ